MPNDACHSHGAVAPWWTKVEFKIVILNIGIAPNASLENRELDVDTKKEKANYYRSYLSSAQMLSNGFGNGWLLSNAEDLAGHDPFSFAILRYT